MGEFLTSLYEPDDLLEIRFVPSKRRLYSRASDLPAQLDRLRRENEQGQNVYLSGNPRLRQGGKAADVALARSVFADLEAIGPEAASQRIRESGLPLPTVLVGSGHGVHAFWRLIEPLTDLKHWTAVQKQLAGLLHSDPKVCDAPRMMRLPGFTNHKPPLAPCTLIDATPQRRYRLEDLLQQSSGGIGEIEHKEEMIASVDSTHSVISVTLLQGTDKAIWQAIRCTTPEKPGQRHKCVFQFARALKGIPEVADLPAGDLKPIMRDWHKEALPFITTQAFDESWADFVVAWRNVRYALGESPLDQIFEAIQSKQPPAECDEYDTGQVRLLLALCSELQRIAGEADFYLDCRAAAKLLDVDPVTVWRWLKMFQADRLLLERVKGWPTRGNKTGRCTRWRWIGRRRQ
jgi:hypothetical protein